MHITSDEQSSTMSSAQQTPTSLPAAVSSTPPSPPPRSSTRNKATSSASNPNPNPSPTTRTIPLPRPSSPTGSVSTSKSGITTHSPRPAPPTAEARKSYRRGSSSATTTVKSSSSSISRSTPLANNISAPPSLEVFDNGGGGGNNNNAPPVTSPTPIPTPSSNNVNSGAFLFDEKDVLNGSSAHPQPNSGKSNNILPDPENPIHRRNLPRPMPPSKCPLLCVFYAEFDIVVGPKVCFQSPHKFMHFDVDVSTEDVHQALDETFQSVIPKDDDVNQQQVAGTHDGNANNNILTANKQQSNPLSSSPSETDVRTQQSDEYWNWSPSTRKTKLIEREVSDVSSQITLPSSGHKDDSGTQDGSASGAKSAKDSAQSRPSHERKPSGVSIAESTNTAANTTAHSSHSRNPSFASSKGTTSNQHTHEGDTSTIDTELMANSIFAATSEYIITGNELANQTITVSTHGMHILSRPMIICDTQRYERNSLLFAVGFVLRRNVDPRPYWPVLSNLSSTFRHMEVESEFLSHQRTRPQIQIVLEDILVSLNSKQRDCHLLLDDANLLNLHLFRPPPPPTPPVPDYAVPILLRPEWQLQLYDWDLTINWIVPHIDGCKYVKQIAVSTEVDMEMVRACLRVLRHHGVLAHVDVFRYTNVYECQNVGLFAGTSGKKDEVKKLLDAAFWYSAKAMYSRRAQQLYRKASNGSDGHSPHTMSNSPSSHAARRLHHRDMSSLHSLDLSVNTSTTPWASLIAGGDASRHRRSITEDMPLPRSFPSRPEHITIREEEHSMDEEASPETVKRSSSGDRRGGSNSHHMKEIDTMKLALAQLYSSCSRNSSFGEMFLAKIEEKKEQTSAVDNVNEKIVAKNFVDATLMPLQESSEPETASSPKKKKQSRQSSNASEDNAIDWKLVFDYFDHRRLITFGIVRGLIKRVHQYPLAYELASDHDDANNSHTGLESADSHHDDNIDDFSNMDLTEQYQIPIEMSAAAEEAAALASNIAMDERSRSTSYSSSPLITGMVPPPLVGREEIILSKLTRKELLLRSKKILLERIASAMDGTRCDDELSCMFELPIEKLTDMLESTGRWNVISVYSCNT